MLATCKDHVPAIRITAVAALANMIAAPVVGVQAVVVAAGAVNVFKQMLTTDEDERVRCVAAYGLLRLFTTNSRWLECLPNIKTRSGVIPLAMSHVSSLISNSQADICLATLSLLVDMSQNKDLQHYMAEFGIVKALLDQFNARNERIRIGATEAVAHLAQEPELAGVIMLAGDTVGRAIDRFSDQSAVVRRNSLGILCFLIKNSCVPNPVIADRVIPELVVIMADSDPEIRDQATLLACYLSKRPEFQLAVAHAKGMTHQVIRLWSDPKATVRDHALQISVLTANNISELLSVIDSNPNALPALVSLIDDPAPSISANAMGLVGEISEVSSPHLMIMAHVEGLFSKLRDRLTDPGPFMRNNAAAVIELFVRHSELHGICLETPGLMAQIVDGTEEANPVIQKSFLQALNSLSRTPASHPALIEAGAIPRLLGPLLECPEDTVRHHASFILLMCAGSEAGLAAISQTPHAIERLLARFSDEVDAVRGNAVSVIGCLTALPELRGPIIAAGGKGLLLKQTHEPDLSVRISAGSAFLVLNGLKSSLVKSALERYRIIRIRD